MAPRRGAPLLAVVSCALATLGCAASEAAAPATTSDAAVGGPRTAPLTPSDPARIDAGEARAIVALGRRAGTAEPDGSLGHIHAGSQTMRPLTGAEQAQLDDQWTEAQRAAARLDTPDKARAAGYQKAAVPAPGIGTHWVKWSLVDAGFDPRTPSMLLFDERAGGASQLVGFSYWLLDASEPQGFAGPNDEWHQHTGICVVNGWVDREVAGAASACAGTYLAGGDLWMLHAWVVPGWENRWGPFANMNPALCPAPSGRADFAVCPDDADAGL